MVDVGATTLGEGDPAPGLAVLARGTMVGRYVVLERIGAGAMGIVYAAYDPELDRRLALKLVSPRGGERATSIGRSRLLREAQALAKLTHPNVVTVHDVGTHGELVFVAMELVAGRTLTAWLAGAPPLPDIVRVLADAGRGLAAAHAKGLVHRDFKPDNVMVADDGRVLVMDFGLARAQGEREPVRVDQAASSSPSAPELTRDGTIVGTPRYMAPEQLLGGVADARSDQFSFCVACYEALFGEHPFTGDSLTALVLAVTQGELRTDAKRARVSPWLRKLVLRGLSTDPAARWPSMDALLDALARDPTRRRRRLLFALAPLALAGAAIGWRTVTHARREAACADQGAAIDRLWNDRARADVAAAFSASTAPFAPDSWVRLRPWLDGHAAAWAGARERSCRLGVASGEPEPADTRACFDESAAELGELIAGLGRADAETVRTAVTTASSLDDPALCLDAAWLARRAPASSDADTRAQVDAVRLAAIAVQAPRPASEHARALAEAQAIVARAQAIDYGPLVAEAHLGLGRVRLQEAEYAAAEAAFVTAFHTAVQASDDRTADAAARRLIAVSMYRAEFDAGLAWARLAESLSIRLGLESSVSAGDRWKLLGDLLSKQGKYDEAFAAHERSREILEARLGPRHPMLLDTLEGLAMAQMFRGELADAARRMQEVLALDEELLGPDHPDLAGAIVNLGSVLLQLGRLDESEAAYQRAIALLRARHGPAHPDVIGTELNLGNVLLKRRQYGAARAIFERALAARIEHDGPMHPLVAETLFNIGGTHVGERNAAAAIAAFERALAIQRVALAPDHPAIAMGLSELGRAYAMAGELERAEATLTEACVLAEHSLGATHPTTGETWSKLATVLRERGRPAEAIDALARARAIAATNGDAADVALDDYWLGDLLLGEGRLDEAEQAFAGALAYRDTQPPSVDQGWALAGLGRVSLARGDDDEAIARLERADAILASTGETPADRAEVRLELARALQRSGRDLPRAIELATWARDRLRAGGTGHAAQLAQAEAWLRAHAHRERRR